MKKLYSLVLCLVMTFMFCGVATTNVSADEATLTEMIVEAHSNAGERTEVVLTPAFSADVTEYEATVANDTIKLVITATTTEEDAEYEVDWEALDVGDNKTFVYVTAADGTETTYTIYTKRLTKEEEATYVAEEVEDAEDGDSEDGNSEDESEIVSTVNVNGTEMKISSDFNESDIPEGFVEAEYEYAGKTYTVIKGETKGIIAMWLKDAAASDESEDGESEEETTEENADSEDESDGDAVTSEEGFYIYDETANLFYDMDNIYIKSRMYTVVEVAEPDPFLNDYETIDLQVIDETVSVWVLDEANSLYLLYAMNWEGETSLYCYDDVEKCFQRYIINSAAATQLDAANEAINNLQNKNSELIKKYNDSNSTKYKIIAVLAILVVILVFVSLNLFLSLRTKQLRYEEDDDDSSVPTRVTKRKVENEEYDRNYTSSYDDDDDDDELFKLVEDDPFVIADDETEDEKDGNEEFQLDMDEIDISAQVMKEMESPNDNQAGVADNSPVVEEKAPFKVNNEEPFNEESLQNILSTAFPQEEADDDDDGFTFI